MNQRRHYSKAPITEAVIDFRLTSPTEASLKELDELFSNVKADYPNQESYLIWTQEFNVGASSAPQPSNEQQGYTYSTVDRKQILIAALGGFTFSRLAPYDCWESFNHEAKRLWEIYQSGIRVDAITRIATRYINRIDIPLPVSDLKNFLRTVPEVSPDLHQTLSGYFMQLQIPQEDIQATIVLNQALIPPPSSDVISILLDIDVSKEISLLTRDTFWEDLEILHTRLDSVFESCITDEVRELIR
jgi:uncharacterized protein (TIGR04255 family)